MPRLGEGFFYTQYVRSIYARLITLNFYTKYHSIQYVASSDATFLEKLHSFKVVAAKTAESSPSSVAPALRAHALKPVFFQREEDVLSRAMPRLLKKQQRTLNHFSKES